MNNELYHYGIKGMRWAESKKKKRNKKVNYNKTKIQENIKVGKMVAKNVYKKIDSLNKHDKNACINYGRVGLAKVITKKILKYYHSKK